MKKYTFQFYSSSGERTGKRSYVCLCKEDAYVKADNFLQKARNEDGDWELISEEELE